MFIASFDIGQKNFSFCIEKSQNINNIQNISTIQTPSPFSGEIVLLKNINISSNNIFETLTRHLDEYISYFDKCSIFVIEQQLKKSMNILRISQHCYSYFSIRYASFKHIILFPAFHKTNVLNAPTNMTYSQRKKWSISQAKLILKNRNENNIIELINNQKKQDDMCDTITQLTAFKVLLFNYITEENENFINNKNRKNKKLLL